MEDATYEVVFYGTEATGSEARKVKARVARLLKLDERKTRKLFERPAGFTLMTTQNERKAKRLVQSLINAGASCNLRNLEDGNSGAWKSWELEEKAENRFQVFQCPACHHAEKLELGATPHRICPNCGVVQSKYEQVSQKKLERERIRRKVLSVQEAKAKKAEDELEHAREEQIRKEIEKEIRREMGLRGGTALNIRSLAAAVAIFAVGAGSVYIYNQYANTAVAPRVAANLPVANAFNPGMATSKTIFLANDLLQRLGAQAEVSNLPLLPLPWAQSTQEPTAQTMLDTAADFNDQPWNTAPATAAGVLDRNVRPTLNTRSEENRAPDFAARNDAEASPILENWFRDLKVEAAYREYLELAHGQRQDVFENLTGADVAQVATSASHRVAILAKLIAAQGEPNPADTLQPWQRVPGGGETLEDKAVAVLAQEQMSGTTLRQTEDTLKTLFADAQNKDPDGVAGMAETIKAQALIAAVRAVDGDLQAANYWFNRANDTLSKISDPATELGALSNLATAYLQANDRHTALELTRRIENGLVRLQNSDRRQQVVDLLALNYASLGMMDQAAQTVSAMADSNLQADIQLSNLSLSTARRGQLIVARGLLSIIRNPAVRAHASARISSIARLANQQRLALDLSQKAYRDLLGLQKPLAQIVASKLLPLVREPGFGNRDALERVSDLVDSGTGNLADDRTRVMIAVNLAWAGEHPGARRLLNSVRERELRRDTLNTLERIEQLSSPPPVDKQRTVALSCSLSGC